jgi:FkbM family methyltransferase
VLLKEFEAVYAFEPHPDHFLQIPSQAFRHQVAIGAVPSNGLHSLREGKDNNGQGHIVPRDDSLIPVQVRTLDGFMISNVDLIKIDVEGWESMVVEGAITTIVKWSPMIILEENGLCQRYGISRKYIHDLMSELDYRLLEQRNKDYIFDHKRWVR